MVFVLREQAQKKSKLSLFRLGKSSKSQTAAKTASASSRNFQDDGDIPYTSQALPPQPIHPIDSPKAAASSYKDLAQDPQRPRPEARRSRSEGEQRSDFSFPPRKAKQQGDAGENHDAYQHERSNSLPLEQMMKGGPASGIPSTVLTRIATSDGVLGHHARQRSHFSIPDVVVTACEEEGEEVHIELEVPADMRRSYVFAQVKQANQQAQQAAKKAAKVSRKKPAPLIDLGEGPFSSFPSSPSLPNLNGAAGEQGSSAKSAASNSATSSASSTISTGTSGSPTRRGRKASFPLLFGRKSLDASKVQTKEAAAIAYAPEAVPMTPRSPPMADEQNVVYHSAHDSTCSLPSSSKESLPGGVPSRAEIFNATPGLPSPPATPVLASRPLSKKELKAREKEEMALIKELERIDKMVREHDLKAKKTAEKAEAKERKLAAAAKRQQQQQKPLQNTQPESTRRSSSAFKRITIFSAASKAGPSANLGRRNSVMRKRETQASVDENLEQAGKIGGMASPPLRQRQQRQSVTGEPEYLAKFPLPPSSPPRGQFQPVKRTTQDSPTRPLTRPPTLTFTSAECDEISTARLADLYEAAAKEGSQKDSGELDNSAWASRDWTELDPRRNSTFSSLVKRDEQGASARPTAPPSAYRFASAVAIAEEDPQEDSPPSGHARRSSVQRVLALADAEETMLRKRNSLRKRGSHQQQQKGSKRSSRLDSAGGRSSTRSSVASDPRRRSLIRQLDALEGWKVADPSAVGGDDVDMADWIDDARLDQQQQQQQQQQHRQHLQHDADFPLPSSDSAMMHEMMHVDAVLEDLKAAQAAGARALSASAIKLPASTSSRDSDGLDDGQVTPRASELGAQRPGIPTISIIPASVESGLDRMAALGSPIQTSAPSSPSRPAKSARRRDSASSSGSCTDTGSGSISSASPPSKHVPLEQRRQMGRRSSAAAIHAGTGDNSSSSNSSNSSIASTPPIGPISYSRPFSPDLVQQFAGSPPTSPSTASSPTTSISSSPVSPSKKAEFRISMAPFQPISLFNIDLAVASNTAER